MKVSELMEFDASKYLKDETDYSLYLAQAFEGGDPVEIQAALGDVAKARGMTALARETGITREALYRALSNKGNAEFATIMKVIAAMGLRLSVGAGNAAPPAKTAPKVKAAAKVPAKKPRVATKRAPARSGVTARKTPRQQGPAHA